MPRRIPMAIPAVSIAEIWTYATRTLTDPDSYKADISGLPTAGDIWGYGTRELTVAMGLVQSEVAKDTLTADGTEQDVINTSGRGKYEGWIDLTNMGAADTIVIKEYVKLKTGGVFRLYASTEYTGVQSEPSIHATRKLSEYGWKVTLEQTAKDGGYKTFDYEFLKEAQA